jgi:acyl-CoA dehydrogenase
MMETALPQHIREFQAVARESFDGVGGPPAALSAETDDAPRQAAAQALRDIGAEELAVRDDPDQTLAAAAVCHAAGATLLPYPVVDELMAIDGARLGLIDPRAARVDHGDLPGTWLLADLDGSAYTATLGPRTRAKLGPFLVEATGLTPNGSVPQADIALHLILDTWRLLGALERAMAIARDHIKARTQFGKPLAEFQAVRFTVADTGVALRGLEELAKFTVSRWNSVPEQIAWTDALLLKLKAVETGVQLIRTCHQLLGALGFCDESDISVIDRHIQPLLRLPVGGDELALRLVPEVSAGHVETLFS